MINLDGITNENTYTNTYSFLTINTTLPASDLLRFRKNLLPLYKNDSN